MQGEECRHNLLYWRYGEYAGVGPGAHGRILVDGRRRATRAEPLPEPWALRVADAGHGIVEASELSDEEQADEYLLMALRLSEGIDLDRLTALSGLAPNRQAVAALIERGLLERCGDPRLRATPARSTPRCSTSSAADPGRNALTRTTKEPPHVEPLQRRRPQGAGR